MEGNSGCVWIVLGEVDNLVRYIEPQRGDVPKVRRRRRLGIEGRERRVCVGIADRLRERAYADTISKAIRVDKEIESVNGIECDVGGMIEIRGTLAVKGCLVGRRVGAGIVGMID